jgi:hypothetical protein
MYNTAMTTTTQHQLSALFHQAKQAHLQAYQTTDGADADWPLWYAGYLLEPLRQLLQVDLTKSELVYLLVRVDREQRANAPQADWTVYYASFFLEQYPQATMKNEPNG